MYNMAGHSFEHWSKRVALFYGVLQGSLKTHIFIIPSQSNQ